MNSKCDVKIVIHSLPKAPKDCCQDWNRYLVVAGRNPFGPKGGRIGMIESGVVLRIFKRYEQAKVYAEEVAKQSGYQLKL